MKIDYHKLKLRILNYKMKIKYKQIINNKMKLNQKKAQNKMTIV